MLLLKDIQYISTPEKYTIKIVCDSTTFVIPITKSIISKHICSIKLDFIKTDLGMEDILISDVSVSYTIASYSNAKTLSVTISHSRYGPYTIAAFDLKNSKILPTITVSNTLGE